MACCACHRLSIGCRQKMKNAASMSTISKMKDYIQKMEADQKHVESHCYKQLALHRTRQELSTELTQSIVYNKNGIICFNKPYGVRVEPLGVKGAQKIIQTLSSSSYESTLSVMQCASETLPDLLKVDELVKSKSCERYASGICIFTTYSKVKNEIDKCFLRSTAVKDMPYTFLVVALGIPKSDDDAKEYGFSLKTVDDKTGEKLPTLHPSLSKRKLRSQEYKTIHTRCSVLSSNPELNVSLLQISTNTKRCHFPRIYAIHKGAAILGDNVHGYRAQQLFGKMVNVNVLKSMSSELQKLPDDVSEKLQLRKALLPLVPVHLHLHQLMLKRFFKRQTITLTAPPPPHFMWTLEQLGLDFNPAIDEKDSNST